MSLLKKTKVAVQQLEFFKEIDKVLTRFFEKLRGEVVANARDDAMHPPPQNISISVLPEHDRVKNSCSRILAEITKNTAKGVLETTLSDYQNADAIIQNNNPYNGKIADLKTERNEANFKLEQDFSNRDADLQESETTLKADLKNQKLDLQTTKKHSLWLPISAFIILGGVVLIGDISYVAKAFSLTGLSAQETYLVSFGLAISTLFLGIGLVEILKSTWSILWKVFGTVSSFALVILVYLVIGKIRVDLLRREMASGVEFSDLSAWDFLLINLIFFVAIVLIHWLIWPAKYKFRENSENKIIQSKIDKTNKEIKAIQKVRSGLPYELLTVQTKASAQYNKSIAEQETEFSNLVAQRSENLTIYNNVYGRLIELFDELNFFYKETVGLYISTLNKYRNDGFFMAMEPLEDLPNPFRNFKYIEANPAENDTSEKEVSDINLNFDELLTNTNNKNHEKVPTNN